METNKISLMDAYMIETLRSNGISDREILGQIELKDVSSWESLHDKFNFNDLVNLANRNKEAFKSVIFNGYKVKFVTYKGLQNLLQMKFDKVSNRDYELIDNGITGLRMEEQEIRVLIHMLSSNWVIHEEVVDGIVELEIRSAA